MEKSNQAHVALSNETAKKLFLSAHFTWIERLSQRLIEDKIRTQTSVAGARLQVNFDSKGRHHGRPNGVSHLERVPKSDQAFSDTQGRDTF